jgi:chloramphenicol-sensitive protein RarD
LLTAVNWGLFIYATTSGRVIDASMGYFINPLVMVLLGVLAFRERPRPLQWAAVGVGVTGVLVLVVGTGRPPWIALCLAASFGAYALIKKALGVGAVVGMTIETVILFLPALAYCLVLQVNGTATFGRISLTHALLMVGASVVMLSPMLLFSAAANRIPLSVAGLLQYLEPVIQFLIGLLVFNEAMSEPRWVAFLLIWGALAVLGYDGFRTVRKQASQTVTAGTPGSSSSRPTAVRSMKSNS